MSRNDIYHEKKGGEQMRGIVFMVGVVALTPLRRVWFAWFILIVIGLMVASVYLLH